MLSSISHAWRRFRAAQKSATEGDSSVEAYRNSLMAANKNDDVFTPSPQDYYATKVDDVGHRREREAGAGGGTVGRVHTGVNFWNQEFQEDFKETAMKKINLQLNRDAVQSAWEDVFGKGTFVQDFNRHQEDRDLPHRMGSDGKLRDQESHQAHEQQEALKAKRAKTAVVLSTSILAVVALGGTAAALQFVGPTKGYLGNFK